jgi:hypothetical protein
MGLPRRNKINRRSGCPGPFAANRYNANSGLLSTERLDAQLLERKLYSRVELRQSNSARLSLPGTLQRRGALESTHTYECTARPREERGLSLSVPREGRSKLLPLPFPGPFPSPFPGPFPFFRGAQFSRAALSRTYGFLLDGKPLCGTVLSSLAFFSIFGHRSPSEVSPDHLAGTHHR